MKINPITKALSVILLVYLFLFVISYSSFLQIPVFENQDLVWQSLVEQSITWMPFVVGYVYLFLAVKKQSERRTPIVNEKKLLLPSAVLIFLIGMSVGVHFASQIIEDALVNQKGLFVYQLAYFLDEQIGHLFLIPGILLLLVLAVMEINRENPKLSKKDTWIVNLLAIFTAIPTSIMSVEAGVVYMISLPILLIAYYKLVRITKRDGVGIFDYPLNRYLVIVTVVTTVFSLFWWSINGFSQPEELGLKLLNF